MKPHLVKLAAAFILPAVTRISYSGQRSQPAVHKTSISEMHYLRTYTTERVFKNGIWWIYVYDGLNLINVYEK